MRGFLRLSLWSTCAFALGLAFGSQAMAAEVSFLSGLYKKEAYERAGDDAGSKSEIEMGARYADFLSPDEKMHWFGQGRLIMRSYEKGPDNTTSMFFGGGVRLYLEPFTQSITPFLYGMAEYRSDKNSSGSEDNFTETEVSGLFYNGTAGIRLSLDGSLFLDLESRFFDSALFGKEESETTTKDNTGKVTTTENETTRTEIAATTLGAFSSTLVSLGMRF